MQISNSGKIPIFYCIGYIPIERPYHSMQELPFYETKNLRFPEKLDFKPKNFAFFKEIDVFQEK